MWKYIYRDLASMVRFLPYGVVVGIPIASLLVFVMNKEENRKEPAVILPVVVFAFYLALMLVITFLSREGGNSKGIDLQLFSTWGINKRNNAFVVENVLLFIPFGFLTGQAFRPFRRLWSCTLLGAAVSLGIECLQLVTGRGFFQIDDILTNILGTVVGYLVYRLTFGRRK